MSKKDVFSRRNNHTSDKPLQVESIDFDLLNSIWNVIYRFLWLKNYSELSSIFIPQTMIAFTEHLCYEHLKYPLSNIDFSNAQEIIDTTKIYLFHKSTKWYQIYDVVEIFIQFYPDSINEFNRVFERENSAYRIIDNKVAPIIDGESINAIEEAISSDYPGVKSHLQRALELLSDRENHDYRNSVKESISAVECLSRKITGNGHESLMPLLNKLEKESGLHPALKKGFSSLYGYTSDEEGIRHSITDDSSKVNLEEAHFFLVACSAFVNYLTQKFGLNQE